VGLPDGAGANRRHPKGGVCRLTLTDLDKQGRDLVTGWAREAGMTVTIDKIGNGFMRRAGRNNACRPS
jgi:N-carbamoyl-L-amino-acid hydrolase